MPVPYRPRPLQKESHLVHDIPCGQTIHSKVMGDREFICMVNHVDFEPIKFHFLGHKGAS